MGSISVIASQRVGATRRPMTGSAKQSRRRQGKDWIASSLTLLAMTAIHILRANDEAVCDTKRHRGVMRIG
jgi:hypothetical protein